MSASPADISDGGRTAPETIAGPAIVRITAASTIHGNPGSDHSRSMRRRAFALHPRGGFATPLRQALR